jgi:GNAT superfamily N-acetyltransferase
VQRARNILAGDLSGLTLGERWPHQGTLDGLRMVAECQAGLVPDSQPQAWLVLLDGVVIGECGTSVPANEAGDIEIGFGLAEPYRGRGFGTEMLVALSRWLLAQDGVHRVTVGDVRTDEVPSFVGRRLAVQAIDPARALATGLPSSAGCR